MSRALARRARSNPMRKYKKHHHKRYGARSVSWGWLAAGATLGAAGFVGYSLYQRPAAAGTMPTVDVASNAIGGAGAGLLVSGLAIGTLNKSLKTAAVGGLVGIGALLVGMNLNKWQPTIPGAGA